MKNRKKSLLKYMAASSAALAVSSAPLSASSHSDAPLIKLDPQANLTDVYAFIGRKSNKDGADKRRVLNVLVSVRPFSEPGDGVIYEKFSDDALYSIHITDPSTGREQLRYDFKFSDVNPVGTRRLKNPDTILSYGLGTEVGGIQGNGDTRQNFRQVYSVFKRDGNGSERIVVSAPIPPPNVGNRATPFYNDADGSPLSGARNLAGLDRYTRQAITKTSRNGEVLFAGPREDGFFADTPAIFDLLDGRIIGGDQSDGLGQAGGGVDGFEGFNVLTYAIQIPLSELTPSIYQAPFADLGSGAANPIANGGAAINVGVGVYASVSRRRVTLRSQNGDDRTAGPWVQVNRLGNPLFNEVLVPLRDKDNYNRSNPAADFSLRKYARTSELAGLLNTVFGTGFTRLNRSDLELVFIPDVLRVDTTTQPVRLAGSPGFSRLGFAGGDTITNRSGRVISSGWPNGRRPGDDVVDVALTAIASGPFYNTVTVLGDNVAENDQLYNAVFPFLGTPHAGTTVQQRQSIPAE